MAGVRYVQLVTYIAIFSVKFEFPRSRSATICAAYLIQEMGMDSEQAVETIRNGDR